MNYKNLTSVRLYNSDDIEYLYRKITEDIVIDGNDITFGNKYEIKKAKEIFAIIQIYGNAIIKILNGETPQKFRWSGQKIRDYQKSFLASKEQIQNQNKINNSDSFEYTYIELLRNYKNGNEFIDQIQISKNKLKEDLNSMIQSNQNVGVLYNPSYYDSKNLPCFNWYQIRLIGEREISIRLVFRSHDYGDAIWANLCGIAYAFNELILKPLNCELKEIILVSTSAHIYNTESDLAENISGFKWDSKNDKRMNSILTTLGHNIYK